MSRGKRKKLKNAIYHIIVKGIKEVTLFKFQRDKEEYLNILSKYKCIHQFKIYAYCIMNTHAHLLIESNGADISDFMKQINLSYAIYYNNTYNREGHVFKDRFKSKIVYNNKYLANSAAYIHKNPKSIPGYKDKLENYKYSSLGVYMNIREDSRNLINYDNADVILPDINRDLNKEDWDSLLADYDNLESNENKLNFYKSKMNYLKRNIKPENIIKFVKNSLNLVENQVILGKKREAIECGICILLIHSFSGIYYKDISNILPIVSNKPINMLRDLGYKYIFKEPIISDFINKFVNEVY